MTVTHVLLVRHPETEANAKRLYVGRGDTPLTPEGRAQAIRLVELIRRWRPDAILSSPSQRCAIVAWPAGEQTGADVETLDELAEMDFGDAEGLAYDEALSAGVSLDLLGGPTSAAPFAGGEAWEMFAARVTTAAEHIEAAGERVAVVTHGGVVRALLTHWLGLAPDAAWRFAVPVAGIAELSVEDGYGVLIGMGR